MAGNRSLKPDKWQLQHRLQDRNKCFLLFRRLEGSDATNGDLVFDWSGPPETSYYYLPTLILLRTVEMWVTLRSGWFDISELNVAACVIRNLYSTAHAALSQR